GRGQALSIPEIVDPVAEARLQSQQVSVAQAKRRGTRFIIRRRVLEAGGWLDPRSTTEQEAIVQVARQGEIDEIGRPGLRERARRDPPGVERQNISERLVEREKIGAERQVGRERTVEIDAIRSGRPA